MGAVERYAFPKVWSPAGGWWCLPPNWKHNTKLCGLAFVPIAFYVFATSVGKEVKPQPITPRSLAVSSLSPPTLKPMHSTFAPSSHDSCAAAVAWTLASKTDTHPILNVFRNVQ